MMVKVVPWQMLQKRASFYDNGLEFRMAGTRNSHPCNGRSVSTHCYGLGSGLLEEVDEVDVVEPGKGRSLIQSPK